MVVTLVILALSAVFFVSGKIRSDVIALCALVLLLLFHILIILLFCRVIFQIIQIDLVRFFQK